MTTERPADAAPRLRVRIPGAFKPLPRLAAEFGFEMTVTSFPAESIIPSVALAAINALAKKAPARYTEKALMRLEASDKPKSGYKE